MTKVVAFLDTNIFLHYQPFDQINWLNEIGVQEVKLAISPIVIRELDHHKDQHTISKIRNRARTSLKKIESLITGQDDVNLLEGIHVIYVEETKLSFHDYGLRTDVNDDHLIASCIERKSLEKSEKVILVTNDTGPRIKAYKYGIEYFELDDRLKLPSSYGQIEKEKRELQNKIQKLQNSLPNLYLGFEDGTQNMNIKIPELLEIDDQKVEVKIKELKRKYPKLYPEEPDLKLSQGFSNDIAQIQKSVLMMSRIGKPSKKEYERYNSDLDKYYQSYQDYLYQIFEDKNQEICTIKVKIVLFNRGTAPANDIDVFMKFPDGFILHCDDELLNSIEPPSPPREPMSSFERRNSKSISPFLSKIHSVDFSNIPLSASNISSVNIKKTNSCNVEFSVKKLKQHLDASCETLYVYCGKREDIASFGIDYRINAANIPHEIEGKLNVAIEKITK